MKSIVALGPVNEDWFKDLAVSKATSTNLQNSKMMFSKNKICTEVSRTFIMQFFTLFFGSLTK